MSEPDARNRRLHRRVPANLLPSLTARLSDGAPVTLLDVSRRGVRIETNLHMRPGETVCIRFVAADTSVTLTAAVVRATVAHVEAEGVRYETALSLAGDLVLSAEMHDAAMRDPDEGDVGGDAARPTDLGPVVDYTVIVRGGPDAPSLLDGLEINS